MMAALMAGLLGLTGSLAAAPEKFIDHGVAAPVSECRGVVTTTDANGRHLVIACSNDEGERGWILVTDIDSGETKQYYYPDGVPNSDPFASLMSQNGRFYTAAGPTLLEFDPTERRWLFHGVPAPTAQCYTGAGFTDGPDGLIYAGSYPNCRLISFDPRTKQVVDHGVMDPQEKYLDYLVAEESGWIYCGIGTARCNLVAYHPRTRELRPLLKEEERALGTALVYRGVDGKIYGKAGKQAYRLAEGTATPIEADAVSPMAPRNAITWFNKTGTFADGRKLRDYNLQERWMEIEGPKKGEVRRLTFDYQSGGASITTLATGPDGTVHGSTAHPMHWFACRNGGKVEDWGYLKRIGGGNMCAMTTQGKYVVGAAYAGGFFYAYDTTRPWNGETGEAPNPRVLAQHAEDVARPRAVLAHPDGKHVLMAGFMGYGRRGGGLGIYNLETGESTLLTHDKLIPDHSTIALKALPDGNLVGGTSVETPGGGHATEKVGVLYILDWATRKVVFRCEPVPGAREVLSLEVGTDGLVYGLARGSQLFVFDPKRREVIHTANLSEYGGVPRPALLRAPDGTLYALLSKALLTIEPGTFRVRQLAATPGPVGAGFAFSGDRLYFAIGAHVWSYGLK